MSHRLDRSCTALRPVSTAPQRLHAGVAFALILALLAAQWLGNGHRVQHGGVPHVLAQAVAAQAQPLAEGLDKAQGPAGHGRLWFHPAGHADCQLLDQLLHADLLPTVVWALPPAPQLPAAVAVVQRRAVAAAPGRPYQARAPPARA